MSTPQTRSAVACLSDNETKVDLLNNEAIAATIIQLLLDHPERPVTIGVHGDWGAGKSSVLEMIEAALEGKDRVLCVKVNGWQLQGFEDAKIAFLEGIVTGLLDKRPALTKAVDKAKAVFRRIDWLKVAKNAGGLALTAFAGIPPLAQIQTAVSTLSVMFRDPSTQPTKEQIGTALDEAHSLLKPDTQSRNVPEEIREFRKAFDDLLDEAEVTRLVVLIDDLDRCLPDTAIETLEAIRLLVFTPRTAYVIAADEAMIEYAVRKHFPTLPDTTGPQTYARNYLEKLIQIPFRIPPLGVAETRIYITLLWIGAQVGEEDPDFGKLIAAARERMKRSWIGEVVDAEMVKSTLGEKAENVMAALTLSDQIGPILASGTKGNPRQIKRFLNALVLRQRIAEARGFGGDVKLPILAKLMLAERFLQHLFDQIASVAAVAPNGVCEELALLEAAANEKEKGPVVPTPRGKPKRDGKGASSADTAEKSAQPQLGEWLSSEAILAWAAIEPPLAGIDIRPYLFVAKDRKDYFGAASVLGHLVSIAEQLLGPRFSVVALEADLKRLAVPDAVQVFGLVRARILGGDTFDKEPPGVAGLTVLTKAHPSLQTNLLDFLAGLPDDRLGPWVVSGWGEVIKDADAVSRFDVLLERWATKAQNQFLRGAATAALQTRKGAR